jgi:hypothetical protein
MHRAWRPGTTVVAWEEGQLCRRKVSDYAFGEQYVKAGTGEGPARNPELSGDTDVSEKYELTSADGVCWDDSMHRAGRLFQEWICAGWIKGAGRVGSSGGRRLDRYEYWGGVVVVD